MVTFPRCISRPAVCEARKSLRSSRLAATRRSATPDCTSATDFIHGCITLATRPRSTLDAPDAPARVRLGRSVLVRGRTEPAVAGERIILRASRSAGSRRAFTVARVRVAADGRFSDRWQPRRRGTYRLYAIYHSRRAELSNDSTPCNLPIEVR